MRRKTWMMTGAGAVALAGGAVLAPLAHADAAQDPIPAAQSYADLLEPVPDAMARIHADDAMGAVAPQVIQTGLEIGINLHHHHHHHNARWYRGHGYFWNGQVWVLGPPPPPPYWHHHHADWYRSNGYVWNGRGWARPHHHHHHHHWR